MNDKNWLAEQFELQRAHLRAVAYRMVGSLGEAEDLVQEAWLRLSRAEPDHIADLGRWLTTVVARLCLDALRSRKSKREDSFAEPPDPGLAFRTAVDPQQEAEIAESVGLALLVLLDRLTPAERLAFVLHDVLEMPFDQIAPVIGRSVAASRQLASRARRRVRGSPRTPVADLASQRQTVETFLAALRSGDFKKLVGTLDPAVALHTDAAGLAATAVHGAPEVAQQALALSKGAQLGRVAVVNGTVGILVAPRGRLLLALRLTVSQGRIIEIDRITTATRLGRLELAVLEGQAPS